MSKSEVRFTLSVDNVDCSEVASAIRNISDNELSEKLFNQLVETEQRMFDEHDSPISCSFNVSNIDELIIVANMLKSLSGVIDIYLTATIDSGMIVNTAVIGDHIYGHCHIKKRDHPEIFIKLLDEITSATNMLRQVVCFADKLS